MPQIIRGVRHNGIVATLGPNGFEPYRGTVKDAAARLEKITRKALAPSIDRMLDSLDTIARKLRHVTDQRREALAYERARDAAPLRIVSATSGYIRDAEGNRIRPMTSADMQRIADEHYGKGRPAAAADTKPAAESQRRPTTAAELQAINDRSYGRVR